MLLITSGCSFSECFTGYVDTWPIHLHRYLNTEKHISLGLGSQGNGLISRKLLHQLSLIDDTSNILVGIMWSGWDRGDIYHTDYKVKPVIGTENPTKVADDKNWIIISPHWTKNKYTKSYYSIMSEKFLVVQTLEHILRVQWYLKLHNIKYFMSSYTEEVLSFKKDKETSYLYNMIDFENWLPISGCYEWCRDNTNIGFNPGDNHPNSEQHKIFTEQVIMPFLKERYSFKI
jgi:hypothetical protein